MNPVLGVVDCYLLCHADHGVLGGHVAGCFAEGDEAEHGGCVDDPATCFIAATVCWVGFLFQEALDGVFAAKEDAAGVDWKHISTKPTCKMSLGEVSMFSYWLSTCRTA